MKPLDPVALARALPGFGLSAGQVGTIVETLAEGVFEVEFAGLDGRARVRSRRSRRPICWCCATRREVTQPFHPPPRRSLDPMHNSLDFTTTAFPGLPKNLVGELANLDAMSSDNAKAIRAMARGIKRLTDDEVIAQLCDEIDMRAEDWECMVDRIAEQCGAHHCDE